MQFIAPAHEHSTYDRFKRSSIRARSVRSYMSATILSLKTLHPPCRARVVNRCMIGMYIQVWWFSFRLCVLYDILFVFCFCDSRYALRAIYGGWSCAIMSGRTSFWFGLRMNSVHNKISLFFFCFIQLRDLLQIVVLLLQVSSRGYKVHLKTFVSSFSVRLCACIAPMQSAIWPTWAMAARKDA